jgi:hypothetical protein
MQCNSITHKTTWCVLGGSSVKSAAIQAAKIALTQASTRVMRSIEWPRS